jgi:probable rRNA maturation factor
MMPEYFLKTNLGSIVEPHPTAKIDIQIAPLFNRRISRSWIRSVIEKALTIETVSTPISVSVVITDDEVMKGLNLAFLGENRTTDVLAFPLSSIYNSDDDREVAFPDLADEWPELGEILVSYPQAKKQAMEARKLIKAEIALLLVHGFLHLMGYDHYDIEEEEIMWKRQDQILYSISTLGVE